jgi:chemotaxis protein methyltransferase CheR
MTEWISKFFNWAAGGQADSMDASGNAGHWPVKRSHQRFPFSGRPEIAEEDFSRLSLFINDVLGIKITPSDTKLLESRLMNRLRTLNMGTFREYTGYLMSKRGIKNELENFINAMTTGKTHFWREADHFEFIIHRGAEELLNARDSIKAWSVGCSTGEEPYTIAMSLAEHSRKGENFHFSVLGSDISEFAIRKAAEAEYGLSSVMNLPARLRDIYLVKDKDCYRVAEGIRETVSLRRINLLDDDYSLSGDIDMAFFRNVGIYFSRELQERILKRICENLSPGGFLFLGHSESIDEFDLPLEPVEGTIYRKVRG